MKPYRSTFSLNSFSLSFIVLKRGDGSGENFNRFLVSSDDGVFLFDDGVRLTGLAEYDIGVSNLSDSSVEWGYRSKVLSGESSVDIT